MGQEKSLFWDFPIIDTHAHVSSEDFSPDREAVIERSRSSGVAFIEVGFDFGSSRKSLLLSEELGYFCAVGLHPHEAGEISGVAQKWATIEGLLDHAGSERVKAIGEIGLDYYRDLSPRDGQMAAFIMGLDLAKRRNLPVIIHQRDAENDLLSVLRRESPEKALVFHCFSQDKTFAKNALDTGAYLGIGGVITYPRNAYLRDVLTYVPKDRILLETDCPYLAPQSRRGRRNEPSFILEVLSCVAGLWDMDEGSVSAITRANALRVFDIDPNDG